MSAYKQSWVQRTQRRLPERGPDAVLSIEKDTEKEKKGRHGVGMMGAQQSRAS